MAVKTLYDLQPGEVGFVKNFVGGWRFINTIKLLGIREGKRVQIITKHPFRGPVVVKVENTTVAIGQNMARRIMVEIT